MPIIVPVMVPHSTSYQSCGQAKFIESYNKDELINIGCACECGVYESGSRWWLWFKINGNYKYYASSYDSREEAKKKLIEIFEDKK